MYPLRFRAANTQGIYGQTRVEQNSDIHIVSTFVPKRRADCCGVGPDEWTLNALNHINIQMVANLTIDSGAEC